MVEFIEATLFNMLLSASHSQPLAITIYTPVFDLFGVLFSALPLLQPCNFPAGIIKVSSHLFLHKPVLLPLPFWNRPLVVPYEALHHQGPLETFQRFNFLELDFLKCVDITKRHGNSMWKANLTIAVNTMLNCTYNSMAVFYHTENAIFSHE